MSSKIPEGVRGIIRDLDVDLSVTKLSSRLQSCLRDAQSPLSVIRLTAQERMGSEIESIDLSDSEQQYIVKHALKSCARGLLRSALSCLSHVLSIGDDVDRVLADLSNGPQALDSSNGFRLKDVEAVTLQETTVTLHNLDLALVFWAENLQPWVRSSRLIERSIAVLELCTSWTSDMSKGNKGVVDYFALPTVIPSPTTPNRGTPPALVLLPVIHLASVCLDTLLVVQRGQIAHFIEFATDMDGFRRICFLLKKNNVDERLRSALCKFLIMMFTHVGAELLALAARLDGDESAEEATRAASERFDVADSKAIPLREHMRASVGMEASQGQIQRSRSEQHEASTRSGSSTSMATAETNDGSGIPSTTSSKPHFVLMDIKCALERSRDVVARELGEDVALMVQREVSLEKADADMLLDRLATALTLFIQPSNRD